MTGNCTAQNGAKLFTQPYFNATAEQARVSTFFLTCGEEEEVKGCTGKVPQRLDAEIRHMRREHSAHSNPSCALRTPFV